MKIYNNGAHIVLDVNTADQENAYELMCTCGHKLSEHASPIFWHYPDPLHHTIHTRQCVHWDKKNNMKFCCEQFQLKENK